MNETPENPAPEGQAADAGQGVIMEPKVESTPSMWYDSFDDETKGYIQNKGWNSEDGTKKMLDSYKNLEKLRGVPEDKLIKIPIEEDAEGWGKVFDKLGRPESKDGYNVDSPEGVELDADRVNWFKDIAHKNGLNNKQYAQMVKATLEYENQIISRHKEQIEQQKQASIDKLKDDWGSGYDERRHLAERGLAQYLDDSESEKAVAALQEAFGHGEVIRMFAKIGEKIGEDKIPWTDGDTPFGYTKEQAIADIASLKSELSADRERMTSYNNAKGADYEKMQKLLKKAYGG